MITLTRAEGIASRLVGWRRDFHRHPELGFEEHRTAERVAHILSELGYRVQTGVAGTGVVAEDGEGSPTVAIRADMDALPILEANDTVYTSENRGLMHACGHDAHVAIALGAATLLREESLPGTVRMLFQPSEERADAEGVSGAQRLAQAGAMDGAAVVIALHVDPTTPTGELLIKPGPITAGVDSFEATIVGHGGHGAMPHRVVDPVTMAAHVIMGINQIISRRLHPTVPAVVGVCSIHGGSAVNVVPDQVVLGGTIRFMSQEVREQIHFELERALEVTRAMDGDFSLEIERGGMPVVNDEDVVATILSAADDVLGPGHARVPARVEMGSEDFSVLSSMAPGAMFWLGAGIEGDERALHNPTFDINERCLPIGAALLAESARRLLASY